MALLWTDGFDTYGTSGAMTPSGILARKYPTVAQSNQITVAAGRLGGYAVKLNDNSPYTYFMPGYLTTDSTLVVGVAVKFGVIVHDFFLSFYDGTTQGMRLAIEPGGEIGVYLGTSLLQMTSGLGLVGGAWYYIEFKVVCGTSGSYQVRIGGVTKLSASSVNTKAGSHNYHNTFRLCGVILDTATAVVFDDLYCVDGSGTENNTFLGNMRVVTLRPDGAGNSTQFTPDSGSNYARVNEVTCDDDGSYVEDATAGHRDLYSYADAAGAANIRGVVVWTDCRETDATPMTLKTVCRSSGTDYPDAGQAVASTSYVARKRIMEHDPATDALWNQTGLNAAQFGVEVG